MLWMSPILFIPAELEKCVTVLDMPLPVEEEYRTVLEGLLKSVENFGSIGGLGNLKRWLRRLQRNPKRASHKIRFHNGAAV